MIGASASPTNDKEALRYIEDATKNSLVPGAIWQPISAEWYTRWKEYTNINVQEVISS